MRRRARLALLSASCLVAIAPPALAAPATATVVTRLSNLRGVSRWAYPESEAPVHALASDRSRIIGRLRFLTDDGQAELYVALASARLPSGQTWIQIELPGRPNGRLGWVVRGALEALHTVDGHLLIDREALRATLFRDG